MGLGGWIRRKTFFSRPSLIYFVTGKCSGRCLHCFSHDMKTGPELSPDEVREFAFAFGLMADLSISGGEPMLRNDLAALLAPFFQIGRPASCTLPTGGLHPNRTSEIVHEILPIKGRCRLTIALPLEGAPDLHDKVRGVDGAFDKLLATYRMLEPAAAAGALEIKLVTTLSTLNQHALRSIADTALLHFPKAVFHHFEPMRASGPDESTRPPDAAILRELSPLIFNHWKRYANFYGPANALALAAKERLFDVQLSVLEGQALPFACKAHEMGLVLYPDGDLAFCESTPVIGNIRNAPLARILEGAPARVSKIDIKSGCSCTHSCFLPKSMMAESQTFPGILKQWLSGSRK